MAYVRQQRLSKAAQRLINTDQTIHQVSADCGFESQAVFSRIFKGYFLKTPKQYRQQQQLVKLMPKYLPPVTSPANHPLNVEIKAKASFVLHGRSCLYNSVHSPNANNEAALYDLWRDVRTYFYRQGIKPKEFHSVVDTSTASNEYNDGITYWAGVIDNNIESISGLEQFIVPAQNYAVFTHRGKLNTLRNTLLQFLLEWIPDSDYQCSNGNDVERHLYKQAPIDSEEFELELWYPVSIKDA